MAKAGNAGEALADNAQVAVETGRGSIDALWRWVVSNQEELLIGGLVAAVIVALMLGLRSVGAMMTRGDPHCTRWRGVIGRVLEKTTIFFMVAASIDIVVSYAEVPERIARLADMAFTIAFAFQGAIWARELILGLIGRRANDDEVEGGGLANAMGVIRVLVTVAAFSIAIIVMLDNLGVNVTALIAGFGIGGIAIGLAAQGIFSDLFAALAILFDRPFRRGDLIRWGTSAGTVEKIGLKTTRLRSFNGEQLVMSNKNLLEQEIQNMAKAELRRTTLNFGVIYQTTPEQLRRIPVIAEELVAEHRGCTMFRCALTQFGASSLDYELIYDSDKLDFTEVALDRTKIMIALMERFAAENIQFAYPTQTTFTAAPDGTMIMPYPAALAEALDHADRDR
ncbi:mechanosensitive ion channel [Sphingomonas sabuli]|uniref:Mechanosensitive ion channel n=1 Tax=Sphingomonas sabuli TaxID=2764186 RepID=A0A7G9L4D6_9SPHN|nr:mechanosensitive ion channel domain-containing protein [Sphingomonas sabuli]QNM83485.1 mechanosensitive ion channel [Sphingomonas sabuli]